MGEPTNTVTIAGAHSLFVSHRNQFGILTGFADLATTDVGVASGVRRVSGVEQVPNPVVPPNRVRRTYDDAPGRIYQFAGVQIPQADLQFGKTDIDLENAAQGSSSWTRGNWKKTIRGISVPVFSDMIVLAHSESVSEDAATNGEPGFWNTLYGDVQLLPIGTAQFAAQATAEVKYSAVLNAFTHYVDGSPIEDNFDVADGTSISWWSQYCTLFDCVIGDGTETDIILDYTPVDAASTKVSKIVISGGVATVTSAAITSVTRATKTIVLAAAMTAGAFYIVEYEALKLIPVV